MNPFEFRDLIVDPVLKYLGLYSLSASNLLIGTAMVESGLRDLRQSHGPALGVYQIEPATHHDMYATYLNYKPELMDKVKNIRGPWDTFDEELIGNLNYATAIARLKYYRDPHPLPKPDDLMGLAAYWKRVYNSEKGAGQVQDFVRKYPF